MLTRCPRCDTTFRVTPEQLKARHGRVRCGHCQDVFNALDTLGEAAPAQRPAPPEIPPAFLREELVDDAPGAATSEIGADAAAEAPATEVSDSPTADEQSVVESDASDEQDSEASAEDAEPEAEVAPESIATPRSESITAAEPESADAEPEPSDAEPGSVSAEPESASAKHGSIADEESLPAEVAVEPDEWAAPPLEPLLHEPPKRRVWPWALGSAVAVAVLLLQAAIHYRTEIAVLYPGAKSLLVAVCAPMGCEVSLPQKSELVGIENSNLSPDSSGKLSLTATLKNRAPFAQQYPSLELTLTDTSDQPLARRVLAPADYLPAGTDVVAGFAARGELSVNLSVDAPGVPAAGYQLYLFYP